MRIFIFSFGFLLIPYAMLSQSLIGSWQLTKQTNCQEITSGIHTVNDQDDEIDATNKTPKILQFKDDRNGEESTRMLHKSKASNAKSFLYKLNDNTLYILDKRSHTISGSFTIDSAQADSLILSSSSRPCEILVFVKVK